MVLIVAVARPVVSHVGSLEPGFGNALLALQEAESAGASPAELSQLVTLLNNALELNRQAMALTRPDQAGQRAELLSQVDSTLTTVQNQAADLKVSASRRTAYDRTVTYVWGAVSAVLGTICYVLILSVYEKYRVKRTLQMKVILK